MLMEKLQQERLMCGIIAIYTAETMLNYTIDYCKKTCVSGKPLSKFQATKFSIAEMASEVKIVKIFIETLVLSHMRGNHIVSESCMAKYRGTELAKQIASKCLEVVESYGMLEASPLAKGFRDIRITTIFAGTNEIMKSIIAKGLGL